MKKVLKNKLMTISSLVGVLIFCVMTILVVQSIFRIWEGRELYYGPYSCGGNTLVIHVIEDSQELSSRWQTVYFSWNGEKIPTIENYNFEGVEDFFELPWTDTCSPLIIQKPDISKAIGTCLKTKIEDGTIENERLKKRWIPLALCGIGYTDSSKKYD